MAKRISGSIWGDVAAAGLSGLPFSIDMDTGDLVGLENLTRNQATRLRAIVADHDADSVTREQVNAERDRRIALPKPVALSGGKRFRVDFDARGRQNVSDLGTAALAKMTVGNSDAIAFTDADNTDQHLTNAELVEMGLLITAQVSAVHAAARALKAMEPIPRDFTDDSYWP